MLKISSLNNERIKNINKLKQKKYRDLNNKFIICNDELVLKYRFLADYIISFDPYILNDNDILVSYEIFNKISDKNNNKIIGIFSKFKNDYQKPNFIVALDDVSDPNNLALILNTMDFYNCMQLIFSKNTTDIYQDKVIEKAKESLFNVDFMQVDLLEEIKKLKVDGYKIYVTGLNNVSKELLKTPKVEKIVLVLGNEARGVREEIFKIADEVIKISMDNLDSLNVAISGAICIDYFQKKNV